MFPSTNLEGLAEWLQPYAEAGATRMIVAYVPSGPRLWEELQAFLNSADALMAGA
jgi:hypothetical protein